jgi:hypothetical protein
MQRAALLSGLFLAQILYDSVFSTLETYTWRLVFIYFLSLWKNQISTYLNHVKVKFARNWDKPYVRLSDIPPPSIKEKMHVAWDILMSVGEDDSQNLGSVHGAEHGAGSDNASSMETSSGGSSDLDTDNDISEVLRMHGIRGVNELHGVNTENRVNDHADIVMDTQEESQNTSADRNGGSLTSNQQVLHTDGFRVTIEFMVNRTV